MPRIPNDERWIALEPEFFDAADPDDLGIRHMQKNFLNRVRADCPAVLYDLRDNVLPVYRSGSAGAVSQAIAEWQARRNLYGEAGDDWPAVVARETLQVWTTYPGALEPATPDGALEPPPPYWGHPEAWNGQPARPWQPGPFPAWEPTLAKRFDWRELLLEHCRLEVERHLADQEAPFLTGPESTRWTRTPPRRRTGPNRFRLLALYQTGTDDSGAVWSFGRLAEHLGLAARPMERAIKAAATDIRLRLRPPVGPFGHPRRP